MFRSLGEVAANPDAPRGGGRRTHQPVRRNSHTAGRQHGVFWKATNRKEVAQIVLAAKRYELDSRQPGARYGALGSVALEVIEFLANLIDYRTGRLEPSLDYLMQKLKRSRDAIHRALKALRAAGFLDWMRRYEPTHNEGRGPQVKQASNAYRLFLPQKAVQALGRLAAASPTSEDFDALRTRVAAGMAAYRASLSGVELAHEVHGADDPLGQALAKLARSMGLERESANQPESQPSYLFYRD